jgi:hypothetical protein
LKILVIRKIRVQPDLRDPRNPRLKINVIREVCV